MTLRHLPALAVAALLAMPALADAPAPVAPAKVEPGTYGVEPDHTMVQFGVSHMGFSEYYGAFTKASGTLKLDPTAPDSSSFDVHVATDSVSTKSDKLTGELKSDQWLDAGKFPEISFKSTKITKTGADTADVTGEFTLHGVTKPLTLKAHYIGAGLNPLSKKYTVGFQLSGKIKRSDYGVKTYLPLIGDEVNVTISAAFERQG